MLDQGKIQESEKRNGANDEIELHRQRRKSIKSKNKKLFRIRILNNQLSTPILIVCKITFFLINLFVTIKTLENFYVLIHKSSPIPKIKTHAP